MRRSAAFFLAAGCLLVAAGSFAQSGGIRGTVMDQDFEVPLPGVKVRISETGQEAASGGVGAYVFENVAPGAYTLLFSKEGYARITKPGVVVAAGQLAETDAEMAGEYEEMDELVVRDIQLGGSSEIGLLNLRMESIALMDSVGADLMSKAGASDAASALRLVSGTTVQEGKYAVVRGLPDRYVSSQINSVRLPTADADKRAVQLDQFPAALIESIQVSKTFTPDQQGDASGGAVNVVLKKVPDEPVLAFKTGVEYNSQATGNDNFLTYNGGGVDYWGRTDSSRALPFSVADAFGGLETRLPQNRPPTDAQLADYAKRDRQVSAFQPTMGPKTTTAPLNHGWSVSAGDSHDLGGVTVGALASFNYKSEYDHYEGGVNDQRIGLLTPSGNAFGYYASTDGGERWFLNDVTQSDATVQWGGLLALGVETENHALGLTYMQTKSATDTVILKDDTRGTTEQPPTRAERYYRDEILRYTDRGTSTLQLQGTHELPFPALRAGGFFEVLAPEIDWVVAGSVAEMSEPDLRSLESRWRPDVEGDYQGVGTWSGFAPDGDQKIGRRIWRDINEESQQWQLNGKLPFEQWTGTEGFIKAGFFHDDVERTYDQDSFAYMHGPGVTPWQMLTNSTFRGSAFSDLYSIHEAVGYKGIDYDAQLPANRRSSNEMPWQIVKSGQDADYDGTQEIQAWYWMADVPLTSWLKATGGVRTEETRMATDFSASDGQTLYFFRWSDGNLAGGPVGPDRWHEANAEIDQTDVLPAVSVDFEPLKNLKFRGAYSQTVARPTFKEISPVLQNDFINDPFVGNNNLGMSELENYDLRVEYLTPIGSFLSASWFHKDITDPIEYVAVAISQSTYIQPFNFPEGWVSGYELEARQDLGRLVDLLEGFDIRLNATFIDSEVTVPEELPDTGRTYGGRTIGVKPSEVISLKRPMRGAPEYLLNANISYDLPRFGTQFNLFYVVKGDTLFSGEGYDEKGYLPNVYEKAYGELNFGISQKFGKHWSVSFMAKNLTDPDIQTVYRSNYIDGEAVKTSYTKGISYSIGLGGEF